ncbi:MAG TPA: aldolase/citrate lyase family protein [Saprospiraceae bacterium]|nr:aldolase/citrate lyase family protein [Saprospiraceae bacterium]
MNTSTLTVPELKQQWKAGQTLYNFFLTQPSAWNAEQYAAMGYPSLTLDMQHGLIEDNHLLALLQAIRAGGSTPVVRLKWNRPELIMKALDYDVRILVCPMISSVAEVEAFVQAAKYPPQGNRSYGPARAGLRGGPNYFDQANDQILTFAMIETPGALEQLEAIAATPGLDGLYIGPFDLTASLGFPQRANFQDDNLIAIIERVLAVAQKEALYTGIFTIDPKDAKEMASRGFDLVTFGTDGLLFQQMAQAWLSKLG